MRLEGPGRRTVRDLFGGAEFPSLGEDGTLDVMLAGHGFYWLKVRPLSDEGEPLTRTSAMPVIDPE